MTIVSEAVPAADRLWATTGFASRRCTAPQWPCNWSVRRVSCAGAGSAPKPSCGHRAGIGIDGTRRPEWPGWPVLPPHRRRYGSAPSPSNGNRACVFMMFASTGLALYDRGGRLTAVAEIKNRHGTSREWAAQTRRNILARGSSCYADYFLLVTPDRLYPWKDAGTDPVRIPPTFEADTQSEFSPYFEKAGLDPHHVSGNAFELLLSTWSGDVIRSEGAAGKFAGNRNWLARSGFHTAVRDGRVEFEATA